MYPIQLIPVTKDYLWGGTRLKARWNKQASSATIAESWELACHPQGESVVLNGEHAGKSLGALLREHPEYLGARAAQFPYFPLLIKFIDAAQDLSVQVHPSDAYALEHEGQFGKTEMWYVADCEEGSGVYCGFKRPLSAQQVREHLDNGTIEQALHFLPLRKGDCVYIPSGTVHAIRGGMLVCEVQQNSSLTYRLYDYGRLDKDGKARELHVDRAIPVICSDSVHRVNETVRAIDDTTRELVSCPYFTVYEHTVAGEKTIFVHADSFVSLTVVDGEGSVFVDGVRSNSKLGHTVFIPAGAGEVLLRGAMTVIAARV